MSWSATSITLSPSRYHPAKPIELSLQLRIPAMIELTILQNIIHRNKHHPCYSNNSLLNTPLAATLSKKRLNLGS
ncbi:MAG: hypothetical protein QXR06_00365 [Candidatus Bathyarchaeia archaeon]